MQFQLSSVVNIVSDTEKLVRLFFTYNGQTHAVSLNHDSLSTAEQARNTLITAVGALVDAYIASKS